MDGGTRSRNFVEPSSTANFPLPIVDTVDFTWALSSLLLTLLRWWPAPFTLIHQHLLTVARPIG